MSDTTRPVLLIDLSAIFRAAYAVNADGPTSVAFEATLGGVHRACGTLENPLVAVCCDGRGSWRKEMHPEYKAHREKQPEAMYGLFDRVKERLTADGFLLWTADTFEADDIIGTATLAATAAGHSVRIATHDKDLAQLLMSDVDILSTRTWDVLDVAKATAKFGVPPRQLGDWLALVGDSSDGVKGCPGIGPKGAAELLTKYGDLDKLFDAVQLPQLKEFTPARLTALRENQDAVRLARKLVTLDCDVPINFAEIYERREMKPLLKKEWETMSDDEMFGAGEISDAPKVEAPKPDPKAPHADGAGEPSQAVTSPAPATPQTATVEVAAKTGNGTDAGHGVSTATETALVPVEYTKQLEPASLGASFRLAQYLYESRMYTTKFKNPEAILAVILRGRTLGLGATVALDVIHFFEDKPSLHAHMIIALGEAHPDCEFFRLVESDNTHATYETKTRRHPEPVRHTYAIQDAVDAGLCGLQIEPRTAPKGEKDRRGIWDKRRAEMLRKTCGVQLVRIVYPKAALGVYSPEELGHEVDGE